MGFDLPTGRLNNSTLFMKIRVIRGGFASLATPVAATIPTVAEELMCAAVFERAPDLGVEVDAVN